MNTYSELHNYILKGENKVSRTIANNTTARLEDDTIVITLHSTDICILQSDDTKTFYTDGWKTSTTKERINDLLPAPYRLYQERGIWHIWNYATQEKWIFAEGLTINASGDILGAGSDKDAAKVDKLRARIKKYANEYITRLCNGKIPSPSGADCWLCLLKNDNGETVFSGEDHIKSHMTEKYYVPSLFVNAIEHHPISAIARDGLYRLWNRDEYTQPLPFELSLLKDQGYKSLVKYLYAQFGLSR